MLGHDAETECLDTINRHLAEQRARKHRKRSSSWLPWAVLWPPSSPWLHPAASVPQWTQTQRFNRAKNQQRQQQQKALWYNNSKMGNYRKMRKFVREKLKGMATSVKYFQAVGETFFRISWWRLKTNAYHVSRILWEGQRKPVLKQKGKGIHLKPGMHPSSIGSFV